MIAHCLFEQSGTFKNEFIKLGYEAYDYDILNDYGQTDFQLDLFKEINDSYNNLTSLFDVFSKDDIIIAFFPCTLFSQFNSLFFRGKAFQQRNMQDVKKLEYCINRMKELDDMYTLISKLCIVCKKGI